MATQITPDAVVDVNRYWDRLEPVYEAQYGTMHADGVAAEEVTVYDDREDVGQRSPAIRVQFRSNGPIRRRDGERRRRVTVFTIADPQGLDELIADLQVARAQLP